ncbi:hypothetical protein TNCV_3184891 [Trichonephila clavipes]|nr:hypothetical protein TNCV_3184891 [Trichonephila clavipes]
MDKCVQMLEKNYGALVPAARVCICVLRTNRTREDEIDFCGLSMRRDEGRVVDPPLEFKRGFLRRQEESLGLREFEQSFGWRELGESAKETDLVRDWRGKEGR